MNTVLFIVQPLLLLMLFGAWVYCIQDALRQHRSWLWVLILVFVPVITAPVYLVNFKLAGAGNEGRIDGYLKSANEIARLKREVAESDIPGTHLKLAEALVRRGEYQDALRSLGRVLESDGENLRAQYLAGETLFAIGQLERALQHLEFVLEEDAKYAFGAARLAMAKTLIALRREEDAFEQLEWIVRTHALPEASVLYAGFLTERGDRQTAANELRSILGRVRDIPVEKLAGQRPWIKKAAEELRRLE